MPMQKFQPEFQIITEFWLENQAISANAHFFLILLDRRLFVTDDPMIVFGTPTDVNADAKMSWNVLPTFNLIPALAGMYSSYILRRPQDFQKITHFRFDTTRFQALFLS